jgi:HK97 family phage portal protein
MNRVDHFLAAFGLARVEQRGADPALSPSGWNRAFPSSAFANAGGVESNIPVALECVSLQARVLAGLPFAAFRRLPDGGRERIRDGSLARIIDAPNAWQSRFAMFESIVRALHFTGNYFAEVKYAGDGLFESIVPLSPNAVTVEQTRSGAIRLRVSEPGGSRVLVAGEFLMVCMPGNSPTDVTGVSTVQRARGALGLTMELNEAAYQSAGKSIGGYIIQAAETNQRSKRSFQDSLTKGDEAGMSGQGGGGAAARFKPKILDPGAKFTPTTFSNEDTQLLQSREFGAAETARIFGTPPGMVGIQQTQSYGSQQQDAQNFVTVCLGPLANRIESAFELCLLSEETRAEVFFEFDLNGLLRADPSERFRQYEIGQRIKLYNQNDLRRMENLPPVEGGDEFAEDAPSPTPEATEPPIASAT